MKDGFVGYWDGQGWIEFYWAANKVGDKLAIPPGPAQAQLRKLCASGEVRAIASVDDEEPEPIPPSRRSDKDITALWGHDYVVAISGSDLRNWLNRQNHSHSTKLIDPRKILSAGRLRAPHRA